MWMMVAARGEVEGPTGKTNLNERDAGTSSLASSSSGAPRGNPKWCARSVPACGRPKLVSHSYSSDSKVSTSWDKGSGSTVSHDNLFSSLEESRERHYRKRAHHARHRAHEEQKQT
jgi:hypothetical protein